MKRNQQAAPEFTTDADGQQLVHVALANTDRRAIMYAVDYQRLMAAGFSPFWTLASTGGRFQYVLVHARSPSNSPRTLTVARWIAGAGKGQRVGYADGDRLNLRMENLELVEGPAKAAVDLLRPNDGTPPRRKPKPQTPAVHAAPVRPAVTPRTQVAAVATQRAPVTPTAPTETQQAPSAPAAPPTGYTSRTVDMDALAQRVRKQVTAGVSYNGGASLGLDPLAVKEHHGSPFIEFGVIA
jgi:hypothetical protein